MTKFQTGTPGPPASGDIDKFGVLSAANGAAATEAARGSGRQWLPPAGGTASATDPAPGVRARMGKKSAWALGIIITAAALSVVLSAVAAATLPGGAGRSGAAGVSKAAATPWTVTMVPVAGASAAPPTAGETPSGAPTRVPAKARAKSSPPSAVATTRAGAPAAAVSVPSPAAATTRAGAAPAAVSVPSPVSFWRLNDDTGTTAQDAMGAHPAVGSNIAWCTYWDGQCANFNGTDSDFATSGPVLDTAPGSSFTVSVWVDMTAFPPSGTFSTIVSQDGTYDSGFYLQYSPNDRWAFSRTVADTGTGPTGIRVLSSSSASLNYWTHLVGVFDASDNQLRLYVDGVFQGSATDSSPFAAAGDLAIGRAQYDGKPTDWFEGSADQVKVYNVALTTAQVDNI